MAMIGKYKNINLKNDVDDPRYIVKVFDHRERVLPVGEKHQKWHYEQNKLLNEAEDGNVYATINALEREVNNDRKALKEKLVPSVILGAYLGICLITNTNDFINTQSQQALFTALFSGALETFFITTDISMMKRMIISKNQLEKANDILGEEYATKNSR